LRLPASLAALQRDILEYHFHNIEIFEVLVVDDGSLDYTVAVVKFWSNKLPNLKVLESGRNYGKGHAAHLGMRAARGDYILVADADGATPWTELNKLLNELELHQAQISIASRDIEGAQVAQMQSRGRQFLGRTFKSFVRLVTNLNYQDTQCGFKLFETSSLKSILDFLCVDNFAWDIEILIAAERFDLRVREVPVEWHHVQKSKVRPLPDGFKMLVTIFKLRVIQFFWRTGIRDTPKPPDRRNDRVA
jgi:glycosyltransferase involved in cell wall biosynthesis